MRKTNRVLSEIINYALYTAGCVIYAAALVMFVNPAQMSPGGMTGVATIINHLTGLPIGVMILIMNIPVALAALVVFGKKFVVRTGVVTVIFSVSIDLAEVLLKPYYVEPILASLFGGILMGFGLGLIMYRGSTTGGFDIIAKLINRRFPSFSLGKCVLALDLSVILVNSLIYQSIESMLYTIIALFISTKVIDLVIYGAQTGKIIYIISDRNEEIAKKIMSEINRGVTLVNTIGGYTRTERPMLMCVVRRYEASKVMTLIRRCDSDAFIITAEAGEINGKGFEHIQ